MKPPVPDDLTPEERKRLGAWVQRMVREGQLDRWYREPGVLRRKVDECLDHHRARGNPRRYHDWPAVCRNWIRKDYEMRLERGLVERWQEPGPRDGQMELLGETLRVIEGGKP